MNYSKYNFRFAEEILNSNKRIVDEIWDIIERLSFDPHAKGKDSPHRAIKKAFTDSNWSSEEALSIDGSKMRYDLFKEKVAIEIETSHIIHTYKDYLKFLVGFNDGKINVGIEIVYDDSFVRKNGLGHDKPTMSKVKRDLENLFRPIIPVPIFVIGLE